jgi:hypothetical protein
MSPWHAAADDGYQAIAGVTNEQAVVICRTSAAGRRLLEISTQAGVKTSKQFLQKRTLVSTVWM